MGADLRSEVSSMGADLRTEMANMRADLIKWMFVFWVGNVVTLGGLMVALLRFGIKVGALAPVLFLRSQQIEFSAS